MMPDERRAGKAIPKPYGLIPGASQRTRHSRGSRPTMRSKISAVLINGTQAQRNEIMQLLREGQTLLSIHEFNEVVSCLIRQKRLSEALSVVELTEHKPLSDLITISKSVKTYTILIDLYGKTQNLERAFSIFYGMFRKGVQPNVITYNAMIAACSRNSEADLANEVFKEMQDNGLKPDKFTYGSLIDLYSKSGNVDQAFELSKEMSLNGVEKDQTIYSALMEGCGRAEQPERAFEVYEEMKRNAIWPNMITFSVLIDMCANAREPERAFHIFAETRHWGYTRPNVVVYTALIDACSKGGWPDKAELVLKNMVRNRVKPNHITYGALLDGWTRKGDFDRAFEVLNRMESKHRVRPNAILVGGLIDACRRHRQCSRVRALWDVIVKYNIKPSRMYYPGLIAMAVSQGELQIACAIVLHAYARGHLRRVALNSENPALHAMACALVYLRHELRVANSEKATQETRKREERLRVVFGSVAMTVEQMDSMTSLAACEYALSWGDIELGEDDFPAHRQRVSNRNKISALSKSISEAAREAKDQAFENYQRYRSSCEANGQ
ncbi:Pentatricopeptide repeat-containing protein [Gracilariopsis chorda]|uniref:Pentatricopeptide repeat-containing protein n=1 Tax=Gracilariopsis chorda TaxID=448386 RepID=A0A2V3IS04_9FLOR|nr:Pentatricopeptide repeat-containing protein [Gracilariopsis chorda]|eukprot:PXF44889.1 Pentatricopeptide repeat-containing protein [Gracilariopsis chorda]